MNTTSWPILGTVSLFHFSHPGGWEMASPRGFLWLNFLHGQWNWAPLHMFTGHLDNLCCEVFLCFLTKALLFHFDLSGFDFCAWYKAIDEAVFFFMAALQITKLSSLKQHSCINSRFCRSGMSLAEFSSEDITKLKSRHQPAPIWKLREGLSF